MRIVRAEGTADVAAVLRALSDQIDAGFPNIEAVIDFPEDGDPEYTRLELRLIHPRASKWNLVQLQAALAHPGD